MSRILQESTFNLSNNTMKREKYIGIISAIPVESRIILEKMSEISRDMHANIEFTKGKIGRHNVILVNCGVSKVNAAMYTQLMIDKYDPELIIFTGVAGSMSSSVGHLDLVLADELTFYDVNPKQLEALFPNVVRFKTDRELSDLIADQAECRRGLIITGDHFVHTKEDKDELLMKFPDALAVEMEGCAVAHVAYVNGVPLAVLRCITDLADDDAEDSYDELEKTAAEKSAAVILSALDNMEGTV